MKDKRVIYHGDPCVTPLTSPAIRTWDDLVGSKMEPCRFHGLREQCSAPRRGCVQKAGQTVARYVLEFYAEATTETLDMEMGQFRQDAPLPPDRADAYVDPLVVGQEPLTAPDEIVLRVREYARALLSIQPGERMFRGSDEVLDVPRPGQ